MFRPLSLKLTPHAPSTFPWNDPPLAKLNFCVFLFLSFLFRLLREFQFVALSMDVSFFLTLRPQDRNPRYYEERRTRPLARLLCHQRPLWYRFTPFQEDLRRSPSQSIPFFSDLFFTT